MKRSLRSWAIAVGVWLFCALWITIFSAGFFASACSQAKLSSEQRLFRCGWSLALSEPLRLIGEPDARFSERYMEVGIAHAELGQSAAAADAFRQALADAGLTPPILTGTDLMQYSPPASTLLAMAVELPQDSAARQIFFEIADMAAP